MSLERKNTVKYIRPPIDFSFYMDYDPDITRKSIFEVKKEKGAKLNHVLWAACRENQTSEEIEIEGKVRGVFTYYFCKILRKTKGNIKRTELKSLISAAVKRAGLPQVLQLETSKDELADKPFV